MLDPMNNFRLTQVVMKEREEAAKQQRLINEALAARNDRPYPKHFPLKWLHKLLTRRLPLGFENRLKANAKSPIKFPDY